MEDLAEVVEGETRGDRVDADGAFVGIGGEGAVEGFTDEAAGVGFVRRGDAVFEVVG